ncbi:thiolase C-terminal domain-containing protein [Cupriavidus malaysiensis]|uniref:Lipid-transfer protein n=1 Tax=Cupriavidus malaysiensis TaxID=367825 RepID=A0ABM6FAT1_9BURK|nr:lipid-transfer protein [Cupriavidus malaysiensis]AOZ08822.1 lipid-transfer protein [Cupriavidus malaysiensis]
MESVCVVGVAMVPFHEPGAGGSEAALGARAARAALDDAGLSYAQVEQAYAGHACGDPFGGQRALYGLGMTGIPVVNVSSHDASGAVALFLARQAVACGAVECALALGFDQPGAGASADLPEAFLDALDDLQGFDPEVPCEAQFFGGAARAYMREHGLRAETLGHIAVKARRHGASNPGALARTPLGLAEVMASPTVFAPLTRLQCCRPASGAAAAVLCSPVFARRHGLPRQVEIAAQAMASALPSALEGADLRCLAGADMAQAAARQVYEAAGLGPADLDLVELHDSATANELITYEALGLTAPGTAERFVLDGGNTYGGAIVTNPSGGLLARGNPPGATGLAQCAELVWQLRGSAGARQVEGARIALQHTLGLGGACVVGLYRAAGR